MVTISFLIFAFYVSVICACHQKDLSISSTNWYRDTRFRKSVPAAERLAFTLRFLASGENQKYLSFVFRIGTTTVSNIIKKTCSTYRSFN